MSWQTLMLKLWTCAWRQLAWLGMLAWRVRYALTNIGSLRAPCRLAHVPVSVRPDTNAVCMREAQKLVCHIFLP